MKLRLFIIPLFAAMAAGCVMPRATTSLGEVRTASNEQRITLVPVSASTIPQPQLAAGELSG